MLKQMAEVFQQGIVCNYLLIYYYFCHLCIFPVFIQPGRVPPKTHKGLVGMEEMVSPGWSVVHVSECVGVCVFVSVPSIA